MDLMQPFTTMLTFEPIVLLPMVKPLMMIENVEDAPITPPEILKIIESGAKERLNSDNDDAFSESASTNAASDG